MSGKPRWQRTTAYSIITVTIYAISLLITMSSLTSFLVSLTSSKDPQKNPKKSFLTKLKNIATSSTLISLFAYAIMSSSGFIIVATCLGRGDLNSFWPCEFGCHWGYFTSWLAKAGQTSIFLPPHTVHRTIHSTQHAQRPTTSFVGMGLDKRGSV